MFIEMTDTYAMFFKKKYISGTWATFFPGLLPQKNQN